MFVPHVKEDSLPPSLLCSHCVCLPDPLCDDLITVFNACDLNGVLIASNAAIWHRDAVHLVPVKLRADLPPAPAVQIPRWHFHCQSELHFTYLWQTLRILQSNMQIRTGRLVLEPSAAVGLLPPAAIMYLKYICASSRRCFICDKVSRSGSVQLSF